MFFACNNLLSLAQVPSIIKIIFLIKQTLQKVAADTPGHNELQVALFRIPVGSI